MTKYGRADIIPFWKKGKLSKWNDPAGFIRKLVKGSYDGTCAKNIRKKIRTDEYGILEISLGCSVA